MCENSNNVLLQPLVDSIYQCGKYILKCVTTLDLPSNVKYKLPEQKSLNIKIGKGFNNQDVKINLRENPNTFIVGTTGSGKSVCTKSILTTLINMFEPNELELYLCDLKRVELNLFAQCKHVKDFSYKINDVTNTINHVLSECEKRYDLFMKHNVVDIWEYNKNRKKKLPFMVLYIEEIVLLLQDKKKLGMTDLKQLLSICRASGIYVFITTQRPSADVIDSVVKANINNRICFKVEDIKNSVICLDSEGAELLKGKGHGILKVGSEKTEFQGYFISSEQTKELIERHNKVEQKTKVTTKQIGFIEENKTINDLSFLDKL